MKLENRIREWIEKGIEAPDAVGVRATSVSRVASGLKYGFPCRVYYLTDAPGGSPSLPFYPYLDRMEHNGIDRLLVRCVDIWRQSRFTLAEEHSAKKQIRHNLEEYGKSHSFKGSPEKRVLKINELEDLDNPDFLESCKLRSGLNEDEIRLLLEKINSRKGIQIALNYKILDDFHTPERCDPHDTILTGLPKRLPPKYISGIKIYTDIELVELESSLGLTLQRAQAA